MRIHPEKKIGLLLSPYQRLLPCILSSLPTFPKSSQERERGGEAKRKGQKQKDKCFWDSFLPQHTKCALCLLFCSRRESSFHFVSRFQKTPEFYNPWNFSKPDLSPGAHMGNQMLPSFLAASSLRLKNVCRSLSTVWNYSPGWAEKRQPAKECHLDSTQCPLICHESTAQRRPIQYYRSVYFFSGVL